MYLLPKDISLFLSNCLSLHQHNYFLCFGFKSSCFNSVCLLFWVYLNQYSSQITIFHFRRQIVIPMLTARHTSQHKMQNHLYQSLKKQRELTNRINVLLIQKEKNLKMIERRIIQTHNIQQNRIQKSLRRQELEQSFENNKRSQIYNCQLFKQLKRQLSSSIVKKQTALRQTKQEWYKKMKDQQKENQTKIERYRLNELQNKKKSKQQVKLTELCIKQNIRKYWDQRLEYIQECKQKDNERQNKLLETSLNNISLLQEKQQQIINELKRGHEYESRLKSDEYDVVFIEDKPIAQWRSPSQQR